jgi:hypothetical protein
LPVCGAAGSHALSKRGANQNQNAARIKTRIKIKTPSESKRDSNRLLETCSLKALKIK